MRIPKEKQYPNVPISVILLTCNRINLLKQVIQSFEEKLKTPYRLIVIDNNSKDGTEEYLKKLMSDSDYPIKLILKWNGRLSEANTDGMKLVESELFITTQDDYVLPELEPDVIQQLISLMEENRDYAAIGLRTAQMKRKFPDSDIMNCEKACPACFRIQRKSEMEKMGGFGHARHWEDSEMTQRCRDILKKKTGIATNLWANNIGIEKADTYPDWYKKEVKRNFEFIKHRPKSKYIELDKKTNKPLCQNLL